MALATLSDALPTLVPSPVDGPGLSARMASLSDALGSILADLDPGLLLGRDAASLYGDFCRLERLVCGGKTLLAPRIAESGLWEHDGHRSAASLLAELEGGTSGAARRTLEAGRRPVDLPGTAAALRKGSLTGPKPLTGRRAGFLNSMARVTISRGVIRFSSLRVRRGHIEGNSLRHGLRRV